jgi:hypothetical protein
LEKILTIEFDKEGEKIEMHFNDLGVDILIRYLQQLKDNSVNGHAHLMTEDWGGNELTNEKQNTGNNIQLINHLKLIYSAD